MFIKLDDFLVKEIQYECRFNCDYCWKKENRRDQVTRTEEKMKI